jgi:hypothetical protein
VSSYCCFHEVGFEVPCERVHSESTPVSVTLYHGELSGPGSENNIPDFQDEYDVQCFAILPLALFDIAGQDANILPPCQTHFELEKSRNLDISWLTLESSGQDVYACHGHLGGSVHIRFSNR